MKELKKVYGHFELLKKVENGLSKVTYTSLEKYSRSPYLQSISFFTKKSASNRTADQLNDRTHLQITPVTPSNKDQTTI